jgi:hypothetical protein
MTNIEEVFCGCGKQKGKKANGPKKDEGTSQSKLGRMGMMGRWMEVRAQLGVG